MLPIPVNATIEIMPFDICKSPGIWLTYLNRNFYKSMYIYRFQINKEVEEGLKEDILKLFWRYLGAA